MLYNLYNYCNYNNYTFEGFANKINTEYINQHKSKYHGIKNEKNSKSLINKIKYINNKVLNK